MIKEGTRRRNNGPWPSYEQAVSQLRRARHGIRNAEVRTRGLVGERPFFALAIAVTAGFLVARLASR